MENEIRAETNIQNFLSSASDSFYNLRRSMFAAYANSNITERTTSRIKQLYDAVNINISTSETPKNLFKKIVDEYKTFLSVIRDSSEVTSKKLVESAQKIKKSSGLFDKTISSAAKALGAGFSVFTTASDVFMGLNILRTGKNVAYTLARGFSTSKYGEQYAESMGIDLGPYTAFKNLPDIILNDTATKAFSNLASMTFSEVESAQSRVKTILPKQQWESNPKIIEQTLERLGNAISQTEAYDMQYQILSAGFISAADSAKVLESAIKLTKAGFAEANEAGTLLVSTMQAYGATAEEASSYAAKLMAIVNNGITTIPELSGVFGQLASVASQAGVAIDDLGAAIAVLTQRGQRTAVAATSISSLIMNLISPTPQAEKALKRYAALSNKVIDINPATIRQKGLTETLTEIYDVVQGNPQALSEIFTEKTAYRAAVGLLSDRGKKMKEFKQSIGESGAKFLEDVFQVSLGNQRERLVSIINKTKDAFVSIGKELAPMYEGFLQAMEKVAETMNKMPEPLKKALGFIIQMRFATSQLFDIISSILSAVTSIGALIISNRIFNVLIGLISSPAGTDTVGGRIKSAAQIGQARRAVLQELFGLDSKYATTVAALEKKGISRANAEAMVNKALRERVDIMKMLSVEENKLLQQDARLRGFSRFTETMGLKVGGEQISPITLNQVNQTIQSGTSVRDQRRTVYLEAKRQRKEAEERLQALTNELSASTLPPAQKRRLTREVNRYSSRVERLRQRESQAKSRFIEAGQQLQNNARLLGMYDRYDALMKMAMDQDFDLTNETNRRLLSRNVNQMAQDLAVLTGVNRQEATAMIMSNLHSAQGIELRRQLLKGAAGEFKEARRAILADTSLSSEARQQQLRKLKINYKESLAAQGLLTPMQIRAARDLNIDLRRLGMVQAPKFSSDALLYGASALASSAAFVGTGLDFAGSVLRGDTTADQILYTGLTGLMAAGTVGALFDQYPSVRRFANPANWWSILTGNDGLSKPKIPLSTLRNVTTTAFGAINKTAGMGTIAQSGKFLGVAIPGLAGLAGAAANGGLLATAAGTAVTGGLLAAAVGLGKLNFDKYFEAKGAEDAQKEMSVSLKEAVGVVKNSFEKIQSLSSVVQENTKATAENTSTMQKMLEEFYAPQMGTASDTTSALISKGVKPDKGIKSVEDAMKLLETKDYSQLSDAQLLAISKLAQGDPRLAQRLSAAREQSFVKEYGSIQINPLKFFTDNDEAAVRRYSGFVEQMGQLEELTSKNPNDLSALFGKDFVKKATEGKFAITPKLQEELRAQRVLMKKRVNEMTEAIRKELAEVEKAIGEELKKGTSEQSLKMRQLRQASEAGRSLLKQAEEAAKQANIAVEQGEDQVESYNRLFNNFYYNRKFAGNYRGARKEMVEKEVQGFEEAKKKLLTEIEQGTATGDFMAVLKNNINMQLESIISAFEEGYYSYEEALKRIQEATTAKIKGMDILSPQERAELEAKIIEFSMQKIEAEQRYLELLKQVKETIETTPYERQVQAAETLSTLLEYRGTFAENTASSVDQSIQRLASVAQSPFARANLDYARSLFDIQSRQIQIENNDAQLRQASARLSAEEQRLIVQSETKQKQYQKEIEKKELEASKKNITVERRNEIEQEIKLLKAEQDLLKTTTAEQQTQLKIRKLLIETQQESLNIQKEFLSKETEIIKRLAELRSQTSQLDYLQEAYNKTQSFLQTAVENVNVPESTKLGIQINDLKTQEDFLEKRYKIEEQVVKLLAEQNKLALDRQRIENEIAEAKLKSERAAVEREMRKEMATGKNKNLIQTYRQQLSSIDVAIKGVQRAQEFLNEQRGIIESSTQSELDFKRNQFELNKTHLKNTKELLTYRRQILKEQEQQANLDYSQTTIQRMELERNRRMMVFDFIGQLSQSAPEYAKRDLQIAQLKEEEQFLSKKLEIEQQIYEINVKKQEMALRTQKLELDFAEKLLQKEIERLEVEKQKTKDRNKIQAINEQIKFNEQSLVTVREASSSISETLSKVGQEANKEIEIRRQQNKLQVDSIRAQIEMLESQKQVERYFGLNQNAVDRLQLKQEALSLAQNANATRQSALSEIASMASQRSVNEAAAYRINKEAQVLSLNIDEQQLNLKKQEVDIAYQLQKIEVSTAKTRLETEMKILEAKREELRLAGASSKELQGLDNVLASMANQRNIFDNKLGLIETQRAAQMQALGFEEGLLQLKQSFIKNPFGRRYNNLSEALSDAGLSAMDFLPTASAAMPRASTYLSSSDVKINAQTTRDLSQSSLTISESSNAANQRLAWTVELNEHVAVIKDNVKNILEVNKSILETIRTKGESSTSNQSLNDSNKQQNVLSIVGRALAEINNRTR